MTDSSSNVMPSRLQLYLKRYRTERGFNPETKANEICKKLSDYMAKFGLTGCVISVSGGIDSAVTYALAKLTQKTYPDIVKRVVPLAQPIHSSDWALNRANELCSIFGDKPFIIDQTGIFDSLTSQVEEQTGLPGNDFSRGQMRSYMRTPVNYFVTQLLSQNGYPSIVLGTGNLDEDMYLKYFCKPGDGTVDVQFIYDCHKSEVFQLAKYLGVPDSIVNAKPSADLWDGQEDENELNVSYDFIELYTGHYLGLSDEGKKDFVDSLDDVEKIYFIEKSQICDDVHRRNNHKLSCAINI